MNAAVPRGRFYEDLRRALDVSAGYLCSVIGGVGLDGGIVCLAQVASIQKLTR